MCLHREGNTEGNESARFRQIRRSPRAMSTSRNCTHENRETSLTSGAERAAGTAWEAKRHKPCVNDGEESNIGVVPVKPLNKTGRKEGGGSGGGKAGD